MKAWLDRVTGRVTMYRLVALLLVVTAPAAIVLSLLGQLPFPPLELAASVLVAVGSTTIAGRLFALAFRTREHVESSLISGLLLFFLFWPSLLPADLITLALAGLLASASKYLIAWRGRHILNPAAAGAALVAVLGLGSATWWVASGALLPFVAVGAFLVLYRTRRMPMAVVFVAVSGVILIVRLASNGQDLADAVATTFTAYPVIFFAGYMLSEPLTLPPRRWQQLTLAAIVGVLFTLPWSFGTVYLSFEAALLIGNVLAFAVGQRRGLRLEYLGRRRLTPTAWEFSFRPDRPVAFQPGQYMELTLPHPRPDARGSRRLFSISSAPGTPITFALRMPQRSSTFKRALLELEPGTRVHATSVGGDFLLPRDIRTPVLLIASGIGITPFLSAMNHDRSHGRDRDVIVVYQVTSLDELAFVDELALENVLVIAPEEPLDLPVAWRWIGSGPLAADLLQSEVPDFRGRRAFVSGSPANVDAARSVLRRAGVRRVRTDYFTGY